MKSTDPSKVSSTALCTRSLTSFHPTCSSHQFKVRYLLSISSLIPSELHNPLLFLSSTPRSMVPPLNSVSRCEPAAGPKPKLPNTRFEVVSSDSNCSCTRSSRSCARTVATYFDLDKNVNCSVVRRHSRVVEYSVVNVRVNAVKVVRVGFLGRGKYQHSVVSPRSRFETCSSC